MDEATKYDKTLYQRSEEYKEVFNEQPLTFSDIQNVWSNYLSSTIDHCGWQAIWKIERFTCESLNVGHPMSALVYIKSIDFDNLMADVLILLIETEVKVDEDQTVPLVDLWPTNVQDKSIALYMNITSNALDMCRFFYKEIMMPWDYGSNDVDWLNRNLPVRLCLYYDMKHNNIASHVKDKILALKSKAKRLYFKIEQLNDKSMNNDKMNLDDDIPDEYTEELIDMMVQLKRIKTIYKCLEDPITRSGFPKDTFTNEEPPNYYFVIQEHNYSKLLEQLMTFQTIEIFENINITFLSDFKSIPATSKNNVIYLNSSSYVINDLSYISYGGTLKGVFENRKALLNYNKDEIMMNINGKVLLENLEISPGNAHCAILINNGTVTMRNCTITGNAIQQGIVLNDAKLIMVDCTLKGFHVGITANTGSLINLTNVQIDMATNALKIFPDVSVEIENCTIKNCTEYGVVYQKDDGEEVTGTFSILQE